MHKSSLQADFTTKAGHPDKPYLGVLLGNGKLFALEAKSHNTQWK